MVDQKRERRYLRKSEKDLIYALAQKEYDSKIQKITGKQLKLLYKLERSLDNASLDDILHELHPAKQDLVLPVELTREQKLMKWYEKEYRGKEIAENDPKFQTKRANMSGQNLKRFWRIAFTIMGYYTNMSAHCSW